MKVPESLPKAGGYCQLVTGFGSKGEIAESIRMPIGSGVLAVFCLVLMV